VSLTISIASLAAMVTQPIIGSLTDRFGMRLVNMVMFGLTCLAALLFVLSPGFWITVGAYAALNLLMNGVNPTIERMATSSPYSYGSIRTWGTVGFAVGTQVTGIIYDGIGPEAPYVGVIFAMLIAIVGFWGTSPRVAETEQANIEDGVEPAEPVSIKDLLTNRMFLFYLVLQIIFSAVTGAAYSFTPAALTSHLGMEASTASTVLSIAVLLESRCCSSRPSSWTRCPTRSCCWSRLAWPPCRCCPSRSTCRSPSSSASRSCASTRPRSSTS
jgi:OHS family lactose permease-like MFS transporter